MCNEGNVVAFQTDIKLPEGFELVKEDGNYSIELSDRASNDHTYMANGLSDGKIRVLCYSPNNTPFTGNEGELFYIPVKVARDASGGNYVVQLWNTRLTLADFTEFVCEGIFECCVNVKPFILGDVNDSGEVTVTDIVVTAQYILEMNPDPFIFDAADMNGDGEITVTDIALIANLILHPTINAPLRASQVLQPVNDFMSGESFNLTDGETRTVSLNLDNSLEYTGFQLDLNLPDGLTASNFALTNREGKHILAINTLSNGGIRVLCYSPEMGILNEHCGAVLTFDVTASGNVDGVIAVNSIEMVTGSCQQVHLDEFAMTVNSPTAVDELLTNNDFRVTAKGRSIIVETSEVQMISIADVAGHIRRVKVNKGLTVIPDNDSGIYIVIADGKACKLILK